MARSDTTYAELKKEVTALGDVPSELKTAKEAALKAREQFLAPMYHQVLFLLVSQEDIFTVHRFRLWKKNPTCIFLFLGCCSVC